MTYPTEENAGPSRAATRGVIVIILAAVLGIVLLASTGGGTKAKNASTTKSTTSAVASTVSTTALPLTRPPTTRAPAQVSVLVLNATNGNEGYAGRDNKAKLVPKGYNVLDPLDIGGQPTTVYFASGYDVDARAVASLLGLAPNVVIPLPPNPPSPAAAQANVTVVIGTDHKPANGASGTSTSGGTSTAGTSTSTAGTPGGGTSTGTSTGGTSSSGGTSSGTTGQ